MQYRRAIHATSGLAMLKGKGMRSTVPGRWTRWASVLATAARAVPAVALLDSSATPVTRSVVRCALAYLSRDVLLQASWPRDSSTRLGLADSV